MLKVIYFCLLVGAFPWLLSQTCCADAISLVMDDCGFSMSYEKVSNGEQPTIMFSEVTAEVISGHRNCGFGYVPRKVDRASVKNIQLEERQLGERFIYIAPPSFDPRKDTINMDYQGHSYISVPESVKTISGKFFVSLRRFPPK